MTPFPGSEFYNTAASYGYFDNDWRKMSAWEIIFIPKGLTKHDIVKYSNIMYKRFYLRPRIVFNYLKRIRSFNHVKVYFTAFLGLISHLMRTKRMLG
jgi:hypothetical protein